MRPIRAQIENETAQSRAHLSGNYISSFQQQLRFYFINPIIIYLKNVCEILCKTRTKVLTNWQMTYL